MGQQGNAEPREKEDAERAETSRKEYLDERKLLIELERRFAQSFDKEMIALNGGALALSIVFLRQIAIGPQTVYPLLLYVAWFGFGISIVLELVSLITSQYSMRKQRDIIDADYRVSMGREEGPMRDANLWSSLTTWLNGFSLLFFIVGASFFAAFSINNVK